MKRPKPNFRLTQAKALRVKGGTLPLRLGGRQRADLHHYVFLISQEIFEDSRATGMSFYLIFVSEK